ncbi:cysteine desulfurase [Aerococcaceae bacterium NML190073]|nr:cysteine desulfurase [Aerococcaceae bacterium NML190073]
MIYYFDNSATTCPSQESLAIFQQVAFDYFANPSSVHSLGEQSRQLLFQSRQQVASILGANEHEIYFTASGTEANNWALRAILPALQVRHPERHQVIVSAVEHPSIMKQLPVLTAEGYDVQICPVDGDGVLDLEAFRSLLCDKTLLVVTMAVNNEVGSIQPLAELGNILADYPQVTWHVDAVQAVATQLAAIKLPRIDVLSLSAHKFHGVRGTGILMKRERIPSEPFIYGGGQETNLRSGTENLASIVVAARTLRLASEYQSMQLPVFRQMIVEALMHCDWQVFGGNQASDHIICAALAGIPGEVLVHAFADKQVMVSTTSACSSRKHQVHSTLKAMGVADDLSACAIRISMSTETTEAEVNYLCQVIERISAKLTDKKN